MTEIVIERRISAPPVTVDKYLTESEKWSLWQGVTASLDARPGGIFAMSMADGATARGQFVELIPDSRVVFTWGWVDRPGIPPGSTTVEIDLSPDGDNTILVLTHRAVPTDEIALHKMGWAHYPAAARHCRRWG